MLRLSLTILVSVILFACASLPGYSGYTDWDLSGDGSLNQHEFVTGYGESNYFLRWGRKKDISADEFFIKMFNSMDRDSDRRLRYEEFQSKIDFYFFSSFMEEFDSWDDDKNDILSEAEFKQHASRVGLMALWDKSGDQKIAVREMAVGMFYLSDVDKDGLVNSLEFNIWQVNR